MLMTLSCLRPFSGYYSTPLEAREKQIVKWKSKNDMKQNIIFKEDESLVRKTSMIRDFILIKKIYCIKSCKIWLNIPSCKGFFPQNYE